MIRDITYLISEPILHQFQFQTSSNDVSSNGLVLKGISRQTISLNITNLKTSETKNISATGEFSNIFTKEDGFFTANSKYNLVLLKVDDSSTTIILQYTEIFPSSFYVLSDNEEFSVNLKNVELIYMTYHTPKYNINPSHKVEFHLHNTEILDGIYISTNNFPDPSIAESYYWKFTGDIFTIDESDKQFCKENYCVYFITVKPKTEGGFSILSNCTFDYIEITAGDPEERADVPPMSSSYGKIYLPNEVHRNYNLDISFYYRKPSELSRNVTNVALFVALVPIINPSTTLWHASTVSGSDGFLRISNNDPYFCMDCTYYLRLDGVPDVYFELDTRIHTYITDEFSPVALYPEDTVRGFFRGKSRDQKLNYKFFIPLDYEDDFTDTIMLKLVQDIFVDENITALVTNNHPDYKNSNCHNTTNWNINFDNTDTGVFYIVREMPGFCTNSTYILTIDLNNAYNRIQNFNIYFNYEVELIPINETRKDGLVIAGTKGLYYIYNRTQYSYYESDMTVYITNNCNKTLMGYISFSSFRDGNDTYEWNFTAAANRVGSKYVDDQDKLYILSPYLYINVNKDDPTDDENCQFTTYITTYDPAPIDINVHQGPMTQVYKKGREGYIYARLDITSARNVQSVSMTLSYTGNIKPISTYVRTVHPPKVQTGEYIMESYVTGSPFKVELRKGMTDFCAKCVYFFAIHFPSDFTESFTVVGEVVSLPTDLYFAKEYEDVIEGNSEADYYILTFGNNAKQPKFFFNVTITSFRPMDYYVAISTDPNNQQPTQNNANWAELAPRSGPVSILIDSTNPAYCINCKYYITVGVVKVSGNELKYKINVDCIDGDCESCPDHFTPESGCTECEKGYFGSKCNMCDCGNHGTCDDGVKGTGKCTCDQGWEGTSCYQCSAGYFGSSCDLCEIDCHGRGKCSDGSTGNGRCICEILYSSESNCTDCRYGYYDHDCSDVCPGAPENICSGNGICNSGISGNGRCLCNENYVGISCETSIYLTKCKPPCDPIHGACDERAGKCFCYDGYVGPLCQDLPDPTPSKQSGNSLSGGIIALIVILVVVFVCVVAGVIFFFRKRISSSLAPRSRTAYVKH